MTVEFIDALTEYLSSRLAPLSKRLNTHTTHTHNTHTTHTQHIHNTHTLTHTLSPVCGPQSVILCSDPGKFVCCVLAPQGRRVSACYLGVGGRVQRPAHTSLAPHVCEAVRVEDERMKIMCLGSNSQCIWKSGRAGRHSQMHI